MCDECDSLRAEVKSLNREIKRLRQGIELVLAFTSDHLQQATQKYNERLGQLGGGGLPRGSWSLYKGQKEVLEIKISVLTAIYDSLHRLL